jgi:hypothetical protein
LQTAQRPRRVVEVARADERADDAEALVDSVRIGADHAAVGFDQSSRLASQLRVPQLQFQRPFA